MKGTIVAIIVCFTVFSGYAQCNGGRYTNKIFTQSIRTQNITYVTARNAAGNMQNVLMDVFEPKNDTMQLRPLVIFEHGGAYWTGTKNYQSQIALGEEFAKRGYVFSSATYRLEPTPISLLFQDLMLKAVGRGVQDTKSLVQFFFNSVRNNSNPYRIDTTKIFLCGGSAGAFNVMHTVYLDSLDNLPNNWRNWLQDIGGVFGNYDFINFAEQILGVVNINGALGDKSYLDNQRTEFLSVHNIWDPEIPFNRGKPYSIGTLMEVDGSNVLHTRADSLGIYNPFYIIPDNGHTSFSSDFFGTVVQPFFDSTVWYMNKFFTYKLGCNSVPTFTKNNNTQTIRTFPNPTFDEIYFENTQQFIGQNLIIYDMNGKMVYNQLFTGQPISTKSIGLSNGIYTVQILQQKNNTLVTGKIIIE